MYYICIYYIYNNQLVNPIHFIHFLSIIMFAHFFSVQTNTHFVSTCLHSCIFMLHSVQHRLYKGFRIFRKNQHCFNCLIIIKVAFC